MNTNLPDGVRDDMIPGNRPEDVEIDRIHEELQDIVSDLERYHHANLIRQAIIYLAEDWGR